MKNKLKYSKDDIKNLERQLSIAKTSFEDEKVIKIIRKLIKLYKKSENYSKLIALSLELIPFYEKINDTNNKALLLIEIGEIYGLIANYDEAIQYTNKAVKIFQLLNNNLQLARANRNLGYIYTKISKYSEAINYLSEAIQILENTKDTSENHKVYNLSLAQSFESVGILYGKLKQLKKSRNFIKKSLEIYKDVGYSFGIAKAYNNLGVSYSKTNSKKTLAYYKKALAIAQDLDRKTYIAVYKNNIGGVYEDLNEYGKALEYYKKALNLSEKNELSRYRPLFKKHMGSIYMKIGQYNKAIDLVNKSIELSIQMGLKELERDNYELLSKIYQKKDDFKKALYFNKKYNRIKDKIIKEEMVYNLSQTEQELKSKKSKIQTLKKYNSLIKKDLADIIHMNFIGKSKKIREVFDLAKTASAYSDTNVLITGESGTGKEIISRIIHYASKRKDYPFVAVNSSSIPETLAESEFFGHIKGSFTGAHKDRAGYLEDANNGTLFLDEIGDMPTYLQADLLRALETKQIKRIGSKKTTQVNFRIISATNKNIDKLIAANKLRIDLLHRINTIEIHIPPLRERPVDIEQLLYFFMQKFSESLNKPQPDIHPLTLNQLKQYEFPGNVRELRNMVEKAMILLKGNTLMPSNFMLKGAHTTETEESKKANNLKTIESMEKEMIFNALKQNNNNRTKAAEQLGISYSTILRKLKNYKI